MSGMEIPLILGAGGALVGSQVDKKNPLRGALLGGAAGGLGGAALAPASAATTAGTAATTAGTAATTTGAMEGAAIAGNLMGEPSPYLAKLIQAGGKNINAEVAQLMAQQASGMGLEGAANAIGATYQPGTVGSGLARSMYGNPIISPAQAMAANSAMGGFQQPQGGTQTQVAPLKRGEAVNLADPIASLLAPKRKKERPMISLL
jgi:hypothetical protein